MMANVKSIKPETIKVAPSQSILILVAVARFSAISDGMDRYAVMAVINERIAPIQKYQPQVVYSAVRPAKNIPTKNPSGAEAP